MGEQDCVPVSGCGRTGTGWHAGVPRGVTVSGPRLGGASFGWALLRQRAPGSEGCSLPPATNGQGCELGGDQCWAAAGLLQTSRSLPARCQDP